MSSQYGSQSTLVEMEIVYDNLFVQSSLVFSFITHNKAKFPTIIIANIYIGTYRLPLWLSGKGSTCNQKSQETQFQSLGREDPLEKEMATQSSILAWRIPWTEEPGGLQSIGSQRVGHG